MRKTNGRRTQKATPCGGAECIGSKWKCHCTLDGLRLDIHK